jgi:hypothetical protein
MKKWYVFGLAAGLIVSMQAQAGSITGFEVPSASGTPSQRGKVIRANNSMNDMGVSIDCYDSGASSIATYRYTASGIKVVRRTTVTYQSGGSSTASQNGAADIDLMSSGALTDEAVTTTTASSFGNCAATSGWVADIQSETADFDVWYNVTY